MPSNTEIQIEEGTRGIAACAFINRSGLFSICIPSSVESIGISAFKGCINLSSVTVNRNTPVEIANSTFDNYQNATLFVPFGCKTTYEVAENWSSFKEIVELEKGDAATVTFSDAIRTA